MKIKVLFIILFFGMCVANVYAAADRDLLIQKELDCISQQKNSGLTWTDVCSMPAPTPADKVVKTDVFNSRVNTFSLAGAIYYYHYAEPDKRLKNTGVWNGFEGKYIFRPPQGNILNNPIFNFYSLEGTYAVGKNDSEASFGTTKEIQKNIPGYMFEPRVLLGRDFILISSLRLTPYLGFGVRYLSGNSDGHFNAYSTGDVIGYYRSDLYYYIPIGLTTDVMVNKDYEISLNMEYDNLVKGYERNRYSDGDQFSIPINGSTSHKALFGQDHGFGTKFSLKFLKHFSLVDVFVEPFVDYWHINKSKATLVYTFGNYSNSTANKNSTSEVGIRFGIEF